MVRGVITTKHITLARQSEWAARRRKVREGAPGPPWPPAPRTLPSSPAPRLSAVVEQLERPLVRQSTDAALFAGTTAWVWARS